MLDLALDNNVFIYNVLDAAIQEIDILFGTYNGELLGNTDFGTNFEQFLWQLTPSEDALKEYILNKFNECHYLYKVNYSVDVQLINDPDIGLYYAVMIELTYNDETKVKKYQMKI